MLCCQFKLGQTKVKPQFLPVKYPPPMPRQYLSQIKRVSIPLQQIGAVPFFLLKTPRLSLTDQLFYSAADACQIDFIRCFIAQCLDGYRI
ncbi:MAG: hypothetical protein RLZZ419_91 [Pseudomonadota bacterium]|jgi:hypothetical protein